MPPFSTTHRLSTLPGVRHGFFGRQGGTSTGLYDSLNLGQGSGDSARSIIANRKLVRDAMQADYLISCYQIHSADVIEITEPLEHRPEADAMICRVPGLALCILTADCVPVLFADTEAGIIGAAHAGWKGAIGGVCPTTIAAMEKAGADRSNIVASIGPAIQQESYEVGEEFQARFAEDDAENTRFFLPGAPGKFQFDLTGYVRTQLLAEGLGAVEQLDHDTCAMEETYFSNRRRNHRGDPDYGRNGSVIVLGD